MLHPERISADSARAYFAHKSQQIHARVKPEELPDEGIEYWECGGVCGLFHMAMWPGVWMAHYGVKPEVWGHTLEPARAILSAFWDAENPELIIGWTLEENRAALAFAKRLGFAPYGKMNLPSGPVILQEWRPR